ncbi:MAG TPA: 50S ribosomal protein L2 [Candidatus Paceibacterota bacterium]
MAIKQFKPATPSLRHTRLVKHKDVVTASEPFKKLTFGRKRHMGRNHHGRITAPHKGGGNKRLYRVVDFLLDKKNIPARIETVEYDPNRSAYIGLALFKDGERRYVVLSKGMTVGSTFIIADEAPLTTGNRMMLKYIPVGMLVNNIELKAGGGAKLARSAGSSVSVAAHDAGSTLLKMPSGEVRKVPDICFATIGEASNTDHGLASKGKAGRSRWRGIRPAVRGTAMNPVDHPHGGGEQKQGIGLRKGPKTRYGKQAYGVKTRNPRKYSRNLVVSRRKTKRNTPK